MGLHQWTIHVHETSHTPNWTLLQACNYLSLFSFFGALFQVTSGLPLEALEGRRGGLQPRKGTVHSISIAIALLPRRPG